MQEEYIIINKTTIQKRIEELEIDEQSITNTFEETFKKFEV